MLVLVFVWSWSRLVLVSFGLGPVWSWSFGLELVWSWSRLVLVPCIALILLLCYHHTVLFHVAFPFCGACFSRSDWRSLIRLPSKVSSDLLTLLTGGVSIDCPVSLFGLVYASDWRSLLDCPEKSFRMVVLLLPCCVACCMFSFTVF